MSIVATDPPTHSRVRPDLVRSAHPMAVEIWAERVVSHAPGLFCCSPRSWTSSMWFSMRLLLPDCPWPLRHWLRLLIIVLLRQDHHAALVIAAVAFMGSLGLRVLESPLGPMLTLAGLIVLGVGGAFERSPTACDLLDGDVQ